MNRNLNMQLNPQMMTNGGVNMPGYMPNNMGMPNNFRPEQTTTVTTTNHRRILTSSE